MVRKFLIELFKMKIKFAIFLCFIVSFLSCIKEATIIDFKPKEFEWIVDQPLIVKKENKLFYSVKNQEKKHIYSLKDQKESVSNDVFVSPNSKKIVIFDDNTLKLLSINSGNKPKVITNDSIKESYRNAQRIVDMQWDSNSQRIAFLSKGDQKDSCLLQIYDIIENEITFKAKIPEVYSFYFSKDGESIFYWDYYDYGKAIYYQISTKTGKILSESAELDDSMVFINLHKYDLLNHTPNLRKRMVDGRSYDWRAKLIPGTYLQSQDTLRLLLRGNWSGKNLKGSTWSYHRVKDSYFLPEGRYYLFNVTSKQYKGILILDTETGNYMKVDEDVEYYYALNSNHIGETENGELKYLKDFYSNKTPVNEENHVIIYD